MAVDERRRALDELFKTWDAGQEQEAEAVLLRIVRMLWGTDKPLLTTSEAAEALGIRSVNTLKVLLEAEQVPTVKHGNRTMIPFDELLRLRAGTRLRSLRAIDRIHDSIVDLGTDDGMTDDDLHALADSRPGSAPWART